MLVALRLAGDDVNTKLIMKVASHVKGFYEKMVVWYFLWPYLLELKLEEGEVVKAYTNGAKDLEKEFGKLSIKEKLEYFGMTSYFFV